MAREILAILLNPVLVGGLLILIGFVGGWRRLIAGGALFTLLMSMPVTGKLLGRPLEQGGAPFSADRVADIAIVLAPTAGSIRDQLDRYWPAPETIWRIAEAQRLGSALARPVAVSGGSPSGREPAEATVARRVMTLPDDIMIDDESRNSAETAQWMGHRLAAGAPRGVLLVTEPFHLRRMSALLRREGLTPFFTPVALDIGLSDFLPSSYSLVRQAAIEYAAIGYYLAIGRLSLRNLPG